MDNKVVRSVVLICVLYLASHLGDLLEDLVNSLACFSRHLEVLNVSASYLSEVFASLLGHDDLVFFVDHVTYDYEREFRSVLQRGVF